jgi:predicted 3-demethylubiquinone-9 3-methyltransferase (glyoxalase superfamily)
MTWQVVPDRSAELLAEPHCERAYRMMQAMLEMDKNDVAALERGARRATVEPVPTWV